MVKIAKALKATRIALKVSLLALAALGMAGLLSDAEPLGGDPKPRDRPDPW